MAVGRVGALCGNVHLIEKLCWITDNSLIIKVLNSNINLKYLELVLYILNLNRFSTSTAQPLITSETIKRRKICISAKDEQQKIANFLNIKTAQFDSII
ncbi:MAG: restriction endonuclease subunit S [Halanaerobiales bacterium]|nr:restriction endonuclease subunit S [Halanaerobiales bacterium]